MHQNHPVCGPVHMSIGCVRGGIHPSLQCEPNLTENPLALKLRLSEVCHALYCGKKYRHACAQIAPDNTKPKGRKKTHTHIPAWVKSAAGGGLAIVTGRPSYLSTYLPTYLPIHIFTLTYIETHRLKKPHTELDVRWWWLLQRDTLLFCRCACVSMASG